MYLGFVRLAQDRPEDALAEMAREPNVHWRRYGLAVAQHALGDREAADAALAELIETEGHQMAFQIAEVHAYRGETDEAIAWLERAYEQRDGGLVMMVGDPLLANLEGDPSYAALIEKMGLRPKE